MNRKKTISIVLLTLVLLVIGAGVNASASALGDDYILSGFQVGYWLVGIAVLVGLLAWFGILNKKKVGTIAIAIFLIGILLLIPFEVAEPATITPSATTPGCCPFKVTATAVTSGSDYITNATYSSATKTLTVPLTVSDSSDGNLTGHITGLNLTLQPLCPGASATDLAFVYLSTDYNMKHGGEYILDEDSDGYMAVWTTEDGTENYETALRIQASESDWARIDYTFVNETSGSWVSELSYVGENFQFYITISDSCGQWSETITVQMIVVSYTA